MGRGGGADSILYGDDQGFSQPAAAVEARMREQAQIELRKRLRSEPLDALALAQGTLGEFHLAELVGEPVREYYEELLADLDDEELGDEAILTGTLSNALSGVFEDAAAHAPSEEDLDRLESAVAVIRRVFTSSRRDAAIAERIAAGDNEVLLRILVDGFPASPNLPEFDQVLNDRFAAARQGWIDYAHSG